VSDCLLGVDPSITSAGLAVIELGVPVRDCLVRVELVTNGRDDSDAVRVARLATEIRSLIVRHGCTWVGVEVPTSLYVGPGGSQTALKVLMPIGAAMAAAGYLSVGVKAVRVSAWKGAKTDKAVSKELCAHLFPHLAASMDDVTDAVLIALAALDADRVKRAHLLVVAGIPAGKAAAQVFDGWVVGCPEDVARLHERSTEQLAASGGKR
jgi:Holliday junction resolvasome RuvABC endonuclease subunit